MRPKAMAGRRESGTIAWSVSLRPPTPVVAKTIPKQSDPQALVRSLRKQGDHEGAKPIPRGSVAQIRVHSRGAAMRKLEKRAPKAALASISGLSIIVRNVWRHARH